MTWRGGLALGRTDRRHQPRGNNSNRTSYTESILSTKHLYIRSGSSQFTNIDSGADGAWPACSPRHSPAMAPSAKPGC